MLKAVLTQFTTAQCTQTVIHHRRRSQFCDNFPCEKFPT